MSAIELTWTTQVFGDGNTVLDTWTMATAPNGIEILVAPHVRDRSRYIAMVGGMDLGPFDTEEEAKDAAVEAISV